MVMIGPFAHRLNVQVPQFLAIVTLYLMSERMHFFDPETGEAIRG
jgi:hypothetical protein